MRKTFRHMATAVMKRLVDASMFVLLIVFLFIRFLFVFFCVFLCGILCSRFCLLVYCIFSINFVCMCVYNICMD